MLSLSEENYLKVIHKLENERHVEATTSAISEMMRTKASSVSDMLKKLADKELINYIKYQDITLTDKGKINALRIIRKHRLWEVFLVEKLDYRWDEVHDIAEQLEHIQSDTLIEKLDKYLGHPATDPHGDLIPDAEGNVRAARTRVFFSEINVGTKGVVQGVNDTSPVFLRYLTKIGLGIGSEFEITDRIEYDQSVELAVQGRIIVMSREAARNVYALE